MKNVKTIIKNHIKRIATESDNNFTTHGYFHSVPVPSILKDSADIKETDKTK